MKRITGIAIITMMLAAGMISGNMQISGIKVNAAIGSDQKKKAYKAYADS